LVFGVFSVFLLLFDKKSFKAGICDAAKACNNNSIDAKRKKSRRLHVYHHPTN